MNNKAFILLSLFCSGCSTIDFEHNGHGKFYIRTEILPTITNDKNFVGPKHIIVTGKKVALSVKF